MKDRKIVLGIYFIAASILLLLCGFGVMGSSLALKLSVPVLLLPVFINGIIKLSFGRILFPAALTVIIFAKELGLEYISPWLILVSALLLTAGLNILFPKGASRAHHISSGDVRTAGTFNNSDPDNVKVSSRCGGVTKYIESQNFTSAYIECSMSGIELYFDKAVMNADGAVLYLDAKLSGIQLYVPREWQVVDKLDCTMSGVTFPKCGEKPLKLRLEGHLALCGLDIKYI